MIWSINSIEAQIWATDYDHKPLLWVDVDQITGRNIRDKKVLSRGGPLLNMFHV